MKLLLTLGSFILISSFFACTKTDNVKTTVYDTVTQVFKDTTVVRDTIYSKAKNPIVGLWVGNFKVDGDVVDSFYQSYTIQANGQVITTDIAGGSSASAQGPWQLNGTTFTASLNALDVSHTVQTVNAVYDSVAGTLSGAVNYTVGSGYNTTILLYRVP
jgi:hypothetical protein